MRPRKWLSASSPLGRTWRGLRSRKRHRSRLDRCVVRTPAVRRKQRMLTSSTYYVVQLSPPRSQLTAALWATERRSCPSDYTPQLATYFGHAAAPQVIPSVLSHLVVGSNPVTQALYAIKKTYVMCKKAYSTANKLYQVCWWVPHPTPSCCTSSPLHQTQRSTRARTHTQTQTHTHTHRHTSRTHHT